MPFRITQTLASGRFEPPEFRLERLEVSPARIEPARLGVLFNHNSKFEEKVLA